HLLNALPVQIDLFYRTGASAVAISVASYAITAGAIAWIVMTITRHPVEEARVFPASDSVLTAIAATAVFALNPNVIYLQSTPLTEPLLLATTTVAVAMLLTFVVSGFSRTDNARSNADSATVQLKPDAAYVG